MVRGSAPRRTQAPWGGLLLVLAVAFGLMALSVRVVRESQSESGVSAFAGLSLTLLGVVAFTWILFIFYWLRGAIRQSAVRALNPEAELFEVVWGYLYLTVAIQPSGVNVYGGSFRPRVFLTYDAAEMETVTLRIVDLQTQTVTRHFLNLVFTFKREAERPDFTLLPVRTRLLIPMRYPQAQLTELAEASAAVLRLPFVPFSG